MYGDSAEVCWSSIQTRKCRGGCSVSEKSCCFFQKTRGVREFCLRDGKLVGGPGLTDAVDHLDVVAALESAGHTKLRARQRVCRLLRVFAPEDAGDVVRAAVRPGDGQHHVADLPAKGRSAIDGRLADRAREAHVILRGLVGRRERFSVDRDDEPPALRRAVVEGADLPGDGDALAAEQVRLLQYVLRCQHGQKIDRARESFDAERQPVKVGQVFGTDYVEVMSGLDADDVIVVAGVNYITAGQKVSLVEN